MKVAVVGATGLVGTKMLQVLAERKFPVSELLPVASERSVGKEIDFCGTKYKVVGMQEAIDAKPSLALFSAALLLSGQNILAPASKIDTARVPRHFLFL